MSQSSQPVPPSNNRIGGFVAKMGVDADAAWPLVVVTIAILVGVTEAEARDFLDSHYGAAFADDLRIEMEDTRRSMRASVINVTILWMAWRVPGGVRHYLRNLIRRVALCSACTLCSTSGMLCVLTNDPCGLNRKPQEVL